MVREFKLPDVGEGVSEGEIVAWHVEVGDTVEEDQVVAEVETDKAVVDVPSPVNGSVREIRYDVGDVVPVGDVIITFDVEGEEAEPVEEEPEETEAAEPAETEAAEPGEAETGGDGETPAASGRVFAAPSARRLARELGVDIESVEGTGPSGRVTESDVRTAAEGGVESGEEAAETGDGERKQAITRREDAGAESAEVATETPTQVESADRDRTLAVPATRRVAREEGVDINEVPAVEQREGEDFVTADAVREYAQAQQRAQEADAAELAAEGQAAQAGVAAGVEAEEREVREPYRGIRRTIGQQMEQSKYTAPHVTHHDDVDVTELVETRSELKPVAEERGIRLTYMPFVMKACVAALKEYPYVNSQLDEESEEIIRKNYYNIGVATATDAGLMVPVVKDIDRKSILQISSEMNELVEKARERSISPEEMRGGTFTVTNIGGIGGEYATPIINHPEVAILALGEIREKPRVVDGEVVPRHVLPLSLSFDHRVLDGAIGARFTNEVKKYLEEPRRLLLE